MATQSKQIEIRLDGEYAGMRLDQALTDALAEFSRARVQSWIKSGGVRVDGSTRKPTYKVLGGEQVALDAVFEANERWLPEPMVVEVIHEDEDLIIVDKPAGLVVHPGAGNPAGTLINGLLDRYPHLAELPRCGIVHRIDKDTSGLLAVASSDRAHRVLVERLSRHEVEREYQAIALGELISGGTVDAPIGRDPRHRIRMAVTDGGRRAVSHFRVIRRFRAFTQLQVNLETGRTHQIRVHMAHMQHPLLGDPLYAGRARMPAGLSETLRDAVQAFGRQALHAVRLSLEHPVTGEALSFESAMPTDMRALLSLFEREGLGL